MTTAEADLLKTITEQHDTMVESLYDWCNINSGSHNLKGLDTMLQRLSQAYTPIADSIETITAPDVLTHAMDGSESRLKTGNILHIKKRPHLEKRILLCGHMDTVFGVDHPFQKVTAIDDTSLNGPGVADMKGGLLVMLHALVAFEQSPHAQNIGWDVIINADEELGSPASGDLLAKCADNYKIGLVYEPAMTPQGTLAKNRKGSGKFTLVATGLAAHAGRDFALGKNAIYFLAEALVMVNQLNGQRQGLTINAGIIEGGKALNIVADKAVVKLDIRLSDESDKQWFLAQMQGILDKLNQYQGYQLELHGDFGRPVKHINQATQKLFEKIQHLARQLNLTIDWQDSGGCCDGNNLAQHGMAVIDTLGVRGGKIHSSDEYIITDSLVERTQLSTLLLMTLAANHLEDFAP